MTPGYIAVISNLDKTRDNYAARIERHGGRAARFSSVANFLEQCGDHEYCGVLVDEHVVVGCTDKEVTILRELEASFPVIRITIHPSLGLFTGTYRQTTLEGEEVFDTFIPKYCLTARPHRVRKMIRTHAFASLHVSFDGSPETRTVSYDLSPEGVFAIWCETDMQELLNSKIQVRFEAMGDNAPFTGIVRWVSPWGQSHVRPPGLGVQFVDLTDPQRRALEDLLIRIRNPGE